MEDLCVGIISLDDGPNTFDVDKAVDHIDKQLENPKSPLFKAMVSVVDAGQHLQKPEVDDGC